MRPEDATEPPLPSQAGVLGYTILCLCALTAMVVALIENDRDAWFALLLGGVGAVGVLMRWRIGPPLVLLGLAALEFWQRVTWMPALDEPAMSEPLFIGAVLAAAVLAYAAGSYRLLSLAHAVFPIDQRRPPRDPDAGPKRGRGEAREAGSRRSAHLPGPWEMPILALAAGAWAVIAAMLWAVLSATDPPVDMAPGLWHAILLVFVVGLTAALLAGTAGYLSWAAASPAEHLLFLQDELWRETRREQNRINRFLTWARLRAQRREEKA